MDPGAIAAAGVPVLCLDTCSILDIMRDPTRETARPRDREAAIDLVSTAEAGRLVCLMAEQVAIEFAEHDQSIQDEAARNLRKLREQVERINRISHVYGAPGTIDLTHLDDHVARARNIVGRWLAQLIKLTPSAVVPAKAFVRMNAALAPARRGKESSKDCLIYETYLEAVTALRSAGVTSPIVFLSSNTDEYLIERRVLRAEIAADFGNLAIKYASNMSAAKHMLGL
jgi:hypothetical protein